MNNVWIAFGITLFAGMTTGIGSIIAFTAKRTNYRFLSISTGFSAGVMLYVSFAEIIVEGGKSLASSYGDYLGSWISTASFFSGILLICLIDNSIPSAKNPHETHPESETAPLQNPSAPLPDFSEIPPTGNIDEIHSMHNHRIKQRNLMRTGLFTALAITIHNFPEGLATFFAALDNHELGLAIAVAIALHNIPEGISVSVPIFYATGNRKKAFIYSLSSGLAEPLGAAFAYMLLAIFLGNNVSAIPPQIMGILLNCIAGIMVYISLDELLPTSRAYGRGHDSILGLIAGMAIMAISLLLMKT